MDMREYEVEFMGIDKKDMYTLKIVAGDIEAALDMANLKKDRESDYICSIREVMK